MANVVVLSNTSFDPPLPGVNSNANSEPPPDKSCTEPLSALMIWAFEMIALPGSGRSGSPPPPMDDCTSENVVVPPNSQVLAEGTLPLITLPNGTTPEPATDVTLPDLYSRSVVRMALV